jgi:DNA-binding transcriptional LysR family regulator
MQIRQLEYFRALMVAGTMTKAAEMLQVSQPSVSTTIAALEQSLGFALFVRYAGRLHPTPEAELFFIEVTRSLAAIESTERAARDIREGSYGRLTIAAYPSISLALLPRIVSIFTEGRPGVQVKIVSRGSNMVKDMIVSQSFDVAIAELPSAHPENRMERFAYRCELIMASDHPLACKEVITPTDLDKVAFISLFRDHATHHQLASAFSAHGTHWKVVAEVEYFATVCELVAAGCGVGLVDPVVSMPFTGGVVRRTFEPAIWYEIALLYPPSAVRSGIAAEFIDLLKVHLKPS